VIKEAFKSKAEKIRQLKAKLDGKAIYKLYHFLLKIQEHLVKTLS